MDAKAWRQWDIKFLQEIGECLRPFLTQSSTSANIVVGVSGGADSLVLLHGLKRILGDQALIVAHLQHGLRSEADEDAAFVQQIAEKWHIQIVLKKVDVGHLAQSNGWTIEEAGRNARYAFFAEVAEQYEATAVAVAHNLDDQAETLLMHLIRGSGLTGLRGMQTVGSVPNHEELTLLRPLLQTSRTDIEKYCQHHDLKPRQDATNQDMIYFRNQIRQELLPLLQTYNPNIKRHLQQLSQTVVADTDYLRSQFEMIWKDLCMDAGEGWLKLSRQAWQGLPLNQQRMALRVGILEIRPFQTDISFQVIEVARQLCAQKTSGTQMDLPGNIVLIVDYQSLIFAIDPVEIPVNVPQIQSETMLPIPGAVTLNDGWQIKATVGEELDLPQLKSEAHEFCVFVALDEDSELIVRGRLLGERMQPLGMNGQSSKLKEIMINRKMARPLRANWPVVATKAHPLWLVGHIIDHRAQVKDNPRKIIQLRCFRENDS